jgi:hypothetical protein
MIGVLGLIYLIIQIEMINRNLIAWDLLNGSKKYYFKFSNFNFKFQNSNNEILLGSTWMHNHDIIFDNDNKRIGLVSSNCEMRKNYNNDYYDNDYNGYNNDINNNKFPTNNDKNAYTCENDIVYLRNICIGVAFIMIIIIAILVYIIRELRKNGRFLWLTLNEDIGKYYLNSFLLFNYLSFFYFLNLFLRSLY